MQLAVKKQVGQTPYTFICEGANLFDVLEQAENLSFASVEKCGCCGSHDIELRTKRPKGFKYVYIQCKGCKAQLTFGQTKENPNTFYLRKGSDGRLDWQPYKEE